MATSPLLLQAPVLGIANLNNGSGTTTQTIYAAGPNGAQIESLTVMSGPTTPPGGTYTAIVEVYDGSSLTGLLFPITLQNSVDTVQYSGGLSFNLAPAAEVRIRMRTALASGATLTATLTGRTY